MPFFLYPQDFKEKKARPGVKSQYFVGEKVLMIRITLAPNSDISYVTHPSEQVTMVLEGEVEIDIAGEVKRLKLSDGCVVPANTKHSLRTFSDQTVLLNCFPPPWEEGYET